MSDYSDTENEDNYYFNTNIEETTSSEFEEENEYDFIFDMLKELKIYKNENCINICEYIDSENLEKFIYQI